MSQHYPYPAPEPQTPKRKPWSTKKQIGVATAIAIPVALIAIAGASGDNEPSTDKPAVTATTDANSPKSQPKAEKPAPKPIRVDHASLIKEFENSEFSADKKYKGKTLKITGGVVRSIDAQWLDDDKYDVSFGDGDEYAVWDITCENVSPKYLDTLAPGQDVKVTGKFVDGGDLGIRLKKCSFLVTP